MIFDEMTEFCDATSATINIGNAILGDVVDLGATPTLRDIGNGEPLYLVLQVTTAFAGAGATVTFDLCSDSTADLATSKTTHLSTGAIPVANLAVGKQYSFALPHGATYERYLGLWETVAATNLSAGAVNAFLTRDVALATAYPDYTA